MFCHKLWIDGDLRRFVPLRLSHTPHRLEDRSSHPIFNVRRLFFAQVIGDVAFTESRLTNALTHPLHLAEGLGSQLLSIDNGGEPGCVSARSSATEARMIDFLRSLMLPARRPKLPRRAPRLPLCWNKF
jgi:hypothetical protein